MGFSFPRLCHLFDCPGSLFLLDIRKTSHMAQTLPDCQHIPLSVVYDCSNPVPDCTSTKRLDFVTLWNYTNVIYRACETDPRLFRPIEDVVPSERSISLTLDACVSATGGGWTSYPRSDIWTRLTTWKFPLLQLVFTFPRPPLSAAIETFVIFHLLGDPIDTIANLLGKLSTCQYWAKHWQEADFQKAEERKRHWRALTLITDAYAEWEADEELKSVLQEALWVMIRLHLQFRINNVIGSNMALEHLSKKGSIRRPKPWRRTVRPNLCRFLLHKSFSSLQ